MIKISWTISQFFGHFEWIKVHFLDSSFGQIRQIAHILDIFLLNFKKSEQKKSKNQQKNVQKKGD